MAKAEDPRLLERIATSAPPASTIDGQLRRRKDQAAIDEGRDPADEILGEDDDPEDAFDPELEALDVVLHEAPPAPAKKKRGRPFSFKPGMRQPKPAAPKIGETGRNWWETTKPGEMTKTAEQEQTRMSGSKIAKRVHGSIND
jgi:hypothetical protein